MENNGVAYVIMPYAKEYERVFRNLIKPAAEKCGLVCERTDKEAKGGHIMSNVIDALTKAEIVIADISGCNWNVAYELGIRHTFNKKGTVLICNDATEFPFDISGYDVILYPVSWLDQNLDDEIIGKIIARIDACHSSSAKSDSPVHDQFPTLPQNLLQFLNTSDDQEQKQIERLNIQLSELREQNNSLQALIDQAGLDPETAKQKTQSTEALIINAIENGKYISDEAVATLRELLGDDKKDEFAKFLAKVLDNGFLDEADCNNVYYMCRKLNNPTIVRIFLERAVEFYPDSEELQGFLADTYATDYRFREKALSMANAMIGLIKKNGIYELQQKARSERMIMSFFNVYLKLRMFKEIIEVGAKLLVQSPNHSALIRRNFIKAYRSLEILDKAEQESKSLIQDKPIDDLNHYEAFQLHRIRQNYFAAYKELEKCIACDSEDTDYYEAMAALICDEKVARTSDGEFVRINNAEKEMYAVPFLIRGILVKSDFINSVISFLRRNRFVHSYQKLINCLQRFDDIELIDAIADEFNDLDFGAVDLCMEADCHKWESEED